MSETAVAEPEQEAEVGGLLPTVDDYEKVMMGIDEGVATYEDAAGLMQDAADGMSVGGSLGNLNQWTTAEATKAGKNFVQHTHEFGGKWTTVYDRLGNDFRMLKEDVPQALLPLPDDEGARRRFLRCPRCSKLPNRGIHKESGPNGCPGREPRLKTYCDVCWSVGDRRPIYEDHNPDAPTGPAPFAADDPLYRAPRIPTSRSREEALQMKLDDHIRAFHMATARQRGLRKD